jgi:hypothetical protein
MRGQAGVTRGVQFVDLDPGHYTLLQNMSYEALIADRHKIVSQAQTQKSVPRDAFFLALAASIGRCQLPQLRC